MANQTRSIHRGVDGREHRSGAINRSDYERAEHQILIPSEYCAGLPPHIWQSREKGLLGR